MLSLIAITINAMLDNYNWTDHIKLIQPFLTKLTINLKELLKSAIQAT